MTSRINPGRNGHAAPSHTSADGPPPGHDAAGHFAKGNRLGHGNPFARRVAALRSALLAAITPERMQKLAERLYRRAMLGDVAAAKLLLTHTLGAPAPSVSPDLLDRQEFELAAAGPELLLTINWLSKLTFGEALQRLAVLRSAPAVTPLSTGGADEGT
jgi:hypothetical protein